MPVDPSLGIVLRVQDLRLHIDPLRICFVGEGWIDAFCARRTVANPAIRM